MNISINQVENNMGLLIDGSVWTIVEFNHVKPGKGSAFVRIRIKNLKTEQVLERTYRSSESLESVELEERGIQNLYQTEDMVHFMDHTTYEEIAVPKSLIGDGVRFLQENLEVTGLFHGDKILKVILPTFIKAEVKETEPGYRGDTSKSVTKPATIDTGASIQVPIFINPGDCIKIDTRSGQYVERVQK